MDLCSERTGAAAEKKVSAQQTDEGIVIVIIYIKRISKLSQLYKIHIQTGFLIDNYHQYSYTVFQLEKVTVNVLFRRNDRRASR